jgi:hypothetical protein
MTGHVCPAAAQTCTMDVDVWTGESRRAGHMESYLHVWCQQPMEFSVLSSQLMTQAGAKF